MPTVQFASTIKCPHCEAQTTVEMPEESCQFFWDCPACEATIRAKPGDCCVFCSYGSVACPPVQRAGDDDACCS